MTVVGEKYFHYFLLEEFLVWKKFRLPVPQGQCALEI